MLPPKVNSHQYADNTTIYKHCQPTEFENGQSEIQEALDSLSTWSLQCNLAFNSKKTKAMLFSNPQLSRVHGLDALPLNLSVNGKYIERVSTFRLLGTQVHQYQPRKPGSLPPLYRLYTAYAAAKTLVQAGHVLSQNATFCLNATFCPTGCPKMPHSLMTLTSAFKCIPLVSLDRLFLSSVRLQRTVFKIIFLSSTSAKIH